MTDLDAYEGGIFWRAVGADREFAEYVDDQPPLSDTSARAKLIRKCALVAIFDRKDSERAAHSNAAVCQTAFWLEECRIRKRSQPAAPRFFYMFGTHSPWTMVELNISTAAEIRRVTYHDHEMQQVWDRVGLTDLRQQLRNWLLNNAQTA